METKGWIIVGIVEALALAIGVALCVLGYVKWYVVPAFLFVPPAILIVALVFAFAMGMRNNGNPFQ